VGTREVKLDPGTKIELTSLRTRRKVTCTIDALLGVGGTAKVYAGVLDDGQHVVLKAQRFHGQIDPGFEVEIELFKKLFHRNIVHCVGVGTTSNQYLVIGFRRAYQNPLLLMMQGDVAEGMRRDRKARYPSLPLDAAIDFGYELLNGLDYLERLGIVHHDVKLANILVDIAPKSRPLEGNEVFGAVVRRAYRGVLIDFGATRSRSYLEAWNRGEAPSGLAPQITPLYSPPESLVETRQADGKLRVTFDPSLDVYAAALVLYALITGHPPYSHLRTPIDMHDLESVIGAKSAERRAEIEPVSPDVVRRVVFEDTKFVGGDRASFDLALYRFLAQRLHPDPAERGSASDMKRDFEKLCQIKSKRTDGGEPLGRKGSQVFLPFEQDLVRVGGRGEHPLYRAARLCGVDLEVKPTEVTHIGSGRERASASSSSETSSSSKESGLDWLDDMKGDAPKKKPPGKTASADSGWIEDMDATPRRPNGRKTRRHRAGDVASEDSSRRPAAGPAGRTGTRGSGVRSAAREGSGVRRSESGIRRPGSESERRRRASNSDRLKASDSARRPAAKKNSGSGVRAPRGQVPKGLSRTRQTPGKLSRPKVSRGKANPYERTLPPQAQAEAPHVLMSPVIGDPVLLSRERDHIVGRDSSLELRIKSDLVSRKHAKISFEKGCFRVVDMGSLNGTYVNGYRVDKPCPVLDGDTITVGGFEIRMRVLKGDDLSLGEGTGGTTRIMYAGKEMKEALPSESFTGDLGQLGLRDVIEILEWKRQTGTLQITPRKGTPGRLFFADGQIVHAEARRARGEKAAVALLKIADGRFSFAQGDLRCSRSIDANNAALLRAAGT
jgi:serine/threonine protein kinase/pSer/pThr/pTyr-binding forkhead associated (FHA) protein